MRVIDILNKIASGEEVPEKIIYNNKIFFLNNKYHWYYTTDDYNLWDDVCSDLETEVEVIEEDPEDKKIKKINVKNNELVTEWKNGSRYSYPLLNENLIIVDKINEIIEKINKD